VVAFDEATAEADNTSGRHFCSVVDQYRTAKSVETEPNRSMKASRLFELWTMDATVIHVAAESDFSKQLAPAGDAGPPGARVACARGAALSGGKTGETPLLRQAGGVGRSLAIATALVTVAAKTSHPPRAPANVFVMSFCGCVEMMAYMIAQIRPHVADHAHQDNEVPKAIPTP
jgi:hypothetical protein